MKKLFLAILASSIIINYSSNINVIAQEKNKNNVNTIESTISIKGDGEKLKLSEEMILKNEQKLKLAEEESKTQIRAKKVNSVGTLMQSTNYNCGPATAWNIINGYVYNNGGSLPSESTLARELSTTTNGTNFGSQWVNVMNKYAPGNNYTLMWGYSNINDWVNRLRNIVPYTINKSNNYGIVANLNHGPMSSNYTIHPFYANKSVGHYVAVHGYDGDRTFISDSNNFMTNYNRLYTTAYYSLGKSTQARGVIW